MPLAPQWPLFLKVNPSKTRPILSNQNKGPHLCSIGVYIYIGVSKNRGILPENGW